jgi:hypothetical protein
LQVGLLFKVNLLETFNTTPQRVRYWIRRFFDFSFHANSHGGHRFQKFMPSEQNLLRITLWDLINRYNLGTVPFFTKKLQGLNFNVTADDVRAIFLSWK